MSSPSHKSVVLFYQYFSKVPKVFESHPDFYVEKIRKYQHDLCTRLKLKGRILIASEGINGTLSASDSDILEQYMDNINNFDLVRDCGWPADGERGFQEQNEQSDDGGSDSDNSTPLFHNVDWKTSDVKEGIMEPFPDLKVSIVKEIISTGGKVSVQDIETMGGQHLTPKQFHEALTKDQDKEVVLVDVRSTFEHDIGHFVHPKTGEAAMNPEMVVFSAFDSTFCAKHADTLKDKKVLMYCTGGIRCEKATVLMKKRGVEDVYQLRGGIHRYLEEYGDQGCFRGLNFVFDQRVALKPSDAHKVTDSQCEGKEEIVGRCIECNIPFDELSGSRLCTVCRDLVLVCASCESKLREYHCNRHSDWKTCYFTFLEIFDKAELEAQKCRLVELRESYEPASLHKNVRRTLNRQISKVSRRIEDLDIGQVKVEKRAPQRCRTCMEPRTVCDGLCWGFWKTQPRSMEKQDSTRLEEVKDTTLPLIPIEVGTQVEPGPDWNLLRLGERTFPSGQLKKGTVVEVKSWGSGGQGDCVAVVWNEPNLSNAGTDSPAIANQPKIYRWGALALNGRRMYDVSKVASV